MVIVGTSAETAPTVPKDNATVDRRIDVVVATTAVSLRPVDRIAPAVRVVVQVSGAIETIVAANAPTIAADTRAAMTVADHRPAKTVAGIGVATTVAVNAGPMIVAPSRDVATIAVPVGDRIVVVAKVVSGRGAGVKQWGSSVATRVPTSRTSRTRWSRRSSIRPCAAIC